MFKPRCLYGIFFSHVCLYCALFGILYTHNFGHTQAFLSTGKVSLKHYLTAALKFKSKTRHLSSFYSYRLMNITTLYMFKCATAYIFLSFWPLSCTLVTVYFNCLNYKRYEVWIYYRNRVTECKKVLTTNRHVVIQWQRWRRGGPFNVSVPKLARPYLSYCMVGKITVIF